MTTKRKRLHVSEEVQIQSTEDLGNHQRKGEREKRKMAGKSPASPAEWPATQSPR